MARKWEKSDLISYLYGEIDQSTKVEMEKAFKEDPDLRKEFEAIKDTSDILGKLEDKEVIPPHYLLETENSFSARLQPYKKYLAVAASILIFFLVGYISGVSIAVSDSQLILGWGESDTKEELLTREQMDQLINEKVQELQANASIELDEKLNEFRAEMDVKMVDFREESNQEIIKLVSNEANSQMEQLNLLANNLKQQNLQSLAEFIEVNNKSQEENVKTMLADFSDYLNRQRIEDLVRIDQNLRTIQNSSESRFEETGVILASIMETVNTSRNE